MVHHFEHSLRLYTAGRRPSALSAQSRPALSIGKGNLLTKNLSLITRKL